MRYRNDYKTLRNAVNLKIRNRKNEFYSNAIEEVRGNLKKTWIKINQIIGRKNKGNRDELIIKHFSAQYSITEMLKGFADEYSNGVKNVIQECSIRLDIQENICSDRSIFIPNAREIDVVNIIHKMSIKKAPGTDKIRLVDVKKCDNMLIELITKFINLSLNEGVIPNELKIAIIKPIYKQGPRNMFGNYRPIAILSTMEKILEHYISKHVTRYIVSNDIICSNQYGFQKGMSTTILLKDFANLINGKLNSNKVIMALFIDFTKAFDTIRHDLLLKSLELIGIRGKLLMWFTNYLKNRLIKISVGNEYSKEYVVEQGVPQGSILGPTLYNLYVNSVFTRVLSSDVFMFADDMAMLSTHFNEDIARNNLQDDYNRILVWAHDRGLKVNEQKTKLLVITTSKKNIVGVKIQSHSNKCLHKGSYISGSCSCIELEEVKVVKYLGILIDCRFSWVPHVENVCRSLRACLAQFYKLQFLLSYDNLKAVYFALVHAIVRYGLQCYGRCAATHLSKIEILNRKILKIVVCKSELGANVEEVDQLDVYKVAQILPTNKLLIYMTLLDNYYKTEYRIPDRGRYNLRSVKLNVPLYFNKYGERQDKVAIPRIMNAIPNELRNFDKIGQMKKNMKNWLLNM